MGFYWHVHMQVAFVQPVNIPANLSWWHTLERLKEFDGGGSRVGTLFSAAARALPDGSAVPETVAKRARTARSVMAIRGEDSDSDDEYGDGDFEVLYNSGPQNFKDAGSAAVTKILGDDSGISVVLMHASESKCGSADDTELLLIHAPTVVEPPSAAQGSGAGDGRGSANCPFGLTMTAIPSGDPPQAADQMRRVLRALGMEPKGEPGWRLITSADGG